MVFSSAGKASERSKHLHVQWFGQKSLLAHCFACFLEEVRIVVCVEGSFVLISGRSFSAMTPGERNLGMVPVLLEHDELISFIPVLEKLISESSVFVGLHVFRQLIQDFDGLSYESQQLHRAM